MVHSFSVEVAKDVGSNAAAVFDHICTCVDYYTATHQNMHDGVSWDIETASSLHKVLPYLSEKQIRLALKKLVDNGYIIVGCFNEDPFDRTRWYTVTARGWKYLTVKAGD